MTPSSFTKRCLSMIFLDIGKFCIWHSHRVAPSEIVVGGPSITVAPHGTSNRSSICVAANVCDPRIPTFNDSLCDRTDDVKFEGNGSWAYREFKSDVSMSIPRMPSSKSVTFTNSSCTIRMDWLKTANSMRDCVMVLVLCGG